MLLLIMFIVFLGEIIHVVRITHLQLNLIQYKTGDIIVASIFFL